MTAYRADVPSLFDMTLVEVNEGLERGTFTSVHLVKAYMARVKEVDEFFHAVIEINPEALTIARELDDERRSSGQRGYTIRSI